MTCIPSGPGLIFRDVCAGPVCQVQGAECAAIAELSQAFRNLQDGWRGQVYGMEYLTKTT